MLLARRPARRRRDISQRPTSRISTAPCPSSRAAPTVAWSMHVGQQVEHAGLPDPHRDAADVAGLAHDPVVAVIDVLEHERLVVDHDALEAGARPRVLDRHRHPARRARDQVVDRRRHRSWTHQVPPPVPAQNWPRSTTTCWGADPHPASVPPLATMLHAPAPPWRITVSGVEGRARLRGQLHRRPRRVGRGEAARRHVGVGLARRRPRRRPRRGPVRCRPRTVRAARRRRVVARGGGGRRPQPSWSGRRSCSSARRSPTSSARSSSPSSSCARRGGARRRGSRAPAKTAATTSATATITVSTQRRAIAPVSRAERPTGLHSRHRCRSRARPRDRPRASRTSSPTPPTSSRCAGSEPATWSSRPSPTSRRSPRPTARSRR